MRQLWSSFVRRLKTADIIILVALCAVFSAYLMWHTFSYDPATSTIEIAAKAWSDFSAHIPLIRSFSQGQNWPPEYPIYPGAPIRYHFLFYLLVGILEKVGVRIDFALNLPSALGFTALLILLWYLVRQLFGDKRVAYLTVLLFLFNGSLTFIRFFTQHPVSLHSLSDILTNTEFVSFAPWGPGDISAFWTLNIYTNQRHLAAAFALALLVIILALRMLSANRKGMAYMSLGITAILAVLPYFHQPTLLILGIFLAFYFLLYKKIRIPFIFIGILSVLAIYPQIRPLMGNAGTVAWYPGYLIHDSLTPVRFVRYWFENIGLHLIFIPLGYIVAPPKARKALLPVVVLFTAANLFKVSVEVAGGHKFFNFALMAGGSLTAFVLVWFWDRITQVKYAVFRYAGYFAVIFSGVTLMLSGVIDLIPIINDGKMGISDIPANREAAWIARHTPKDAVFLNSDFLFHPASIAGRKIFLGWPYFAWSAGYEDNRMEAMRIMYESQNPAVFCPLLTANHISYVTVEDTHNDPNLPRIDTSYFLNSFSPIYVNPTDPFAVFTVDSLCQGYDSET